MTIPFYKFDGAGNDFVVVDNREGRYSLTDNEVARICHRRFGVGADGLMTLDSASDGYNFTMRYYNSDGHLGSMCGNGGRCIAMLASLLGMGRSLSFVGYDGPHAAQIEQWDDERRCGVVRLGMHDVSKGEMRQVEGGCFLDTGSPHYVLEVQGLADYDVVGQGRRWRQRTDLFPQGANIDFVERHADGRLDMRTYERGVEDETLACGTGVTAVALVMGQHHDIHTRGGAVFSVDYNESDHAFTDINLIGPVSLNFTGTWISSAR